MAALNFPDNGYKSLVGVTDKLVTVAQARLEGILNKVASVNEVNKVILTPGIYVTKGDGATQFLIDDPDQIQ